MTEMEIVEFNKKNVTTGHSKKGYGQAYFAKRDFKKDEKVMSGFGRIVDHQTAHCSVQIGFNKHFVPKKWTARYWNHSCDPNTYAKTRKDGFIDLYALKNFKKGEEITYSYWMTEYAWSKNADENEVKCLCGSKSCKGRILSFSQISAKQQGLLKKKGKIAEYLKGVFE